MHDDDVFDLLTAIEETTPIGSKAERFEAMAEEMTPGEHGRATFLLAAGEHWQMRQKYDNARRCFELALGDGGETATEPLANLLGLALETGDEPQASSLALELRGLVRQGDIGASGCHFIGETFETHGRLREAMRWFTIPLSYVDPEDEDDLDFYCLSGRHRVRRELGLPEDRYDLAAVAARRRRSQYAGDSH